MIFLFYLKKKKKKAHFSYPVVLITTTHDNFGPMTIMTIGSLHRFSLRKGWCKSWSSLPGGTQRTLSVKYDTYN